MDGFIYFKERIQILFGEYVIRDGNNKEDFWVNNEEIFCNQFQYF